MEHEITVNLSNEGTRNEVRMRVVDYLAKEEPGTGKDSLASKYKYYVELLESGERVYLRIPDNLHNGFDFLVCVENTNYAEQGERRRNYPKHEDIKEDLIIKKNENPDMYANLYQVLRRVFECHDVDASEYRDIRFNFGLPVGHLVKTIIWLFIEQDVRCWNYSRCEMT